MKFIGNLYLYFIVFATIWSGALVFVCNAGIYSWLAVIALSIVIALISNHYDGKHYDWLFCWRKKWIVRFRKWVEMKTEELIKAKKYIEHVIGTIKHDGHLGTIQTDWILPDLEKALAAIGGCDE